MPTPQVIALTQIDETVQVREALAGAAITPGDLVATTNAAVETVVVSPTASGLTGPQFALPNTASGGDIDTDYAAGETARVLTARPGDEVYAWLTTGESTVRFTTNLVSNGALGTLDAAGIETGRELIALALETITTAAAKVRIKVRVL